MSSPQELVVEVEDTGIDGSNKMSDSISFSVTILDNSGYSDIEIDDQIAFRFTGKWFYNIGYSPGLSNYYLDISSDNCTVILVDGYLGVF